MKTFNDVQFRSSNEPVEDSPSDDRFVHVTLTCLSQMPFLLSPSGSTSCIYHHNRMVTNDFISHYNSNEVCLIDAPEFKEKENNIQLV